MHQSKKYIVITRPTEDSHHFKFQLEKIGFHVLVYSSINVSSFPLSDDMKIHLHSLQNYDWIIFTSKNGVHYFMQELLTLGIDKEILQSLHIGAVGPKTNEELNKYDLQAHFVPSEFTTDDLAKEITDIKGKKILLPRSNIESPLLTKMLKEKNALVTEIPIYKTEYLAGENNEFKELLEKNQVSLLTFTSPSTVEGFLRSIPNKDQLKVLSLPILSIGPVTTEAANRHGFINSTTADIYTVDGMMKKIQEIFI
jgi:uroporphyrinogen-III synthase